MQVSKLEMNFDDLWDKLFPNIDLEAEVDNLIKGRKFRFDYGHLEAKVLIEIQGGIWTNSGHSSGTGLMRDYEKNNLAQTEGYAVFLLSGEMITEEWLNIVAQTIESRLRKKSSVKKIDRPPRTIGQYE